MRWLGLATVIVLLAIGFAAYAQPSFFPPGVGDRLPDLIYLVMVILLVAGAGFGFARLKADRARILPALLFWAAAIAAIAFLYNIFV